jgi:hypothetical protein
VLSPDFGIANGEPPPGVVVDRIGKRVGEVDAVESSQIVDGLTELITQRSVPDLPPTFLP